MGGNGPHNGARNSSFGLATLGLDRFAGLAGTGTLVTRAVIVTGKTLMLTADVKVYKYIKAPPSNFSLSLFFSS